MLSNKLKLFFVGSFLFLLTGAFSSVIADRGDVMPSCGPRPFTCSGPDTLGPTKTGQCTWQCYAYFAGAGKGTGDVKHTVNCKDGHCPSCSDSSWSPSTNTVCKGKKFTQKSNCGSKRTVRGTKSCGSGGGSGGGGCKDSSWSPLPGTVCAGHQFTQTSNCNHRRNAYGTKNCSKCTGLLSAGMKPCPGTTTGLTKDTGWELIDNCENAGDAKCKYEFQCSDGDPTKQPPFKATWCPGDDHGLTSRTNWHEVSACTTTDKCEYYFKPECGPANKHSFSTETQVEQAGLCETNNTASSIDSSGLEVGDPWTWTCSRSGQTIDCKAYQIGQCNSNHNSLSLNSACTAGKINSIYFDSTTPKLTWACGTLTNGQPANPPLTLLRDGTAIPGYNFTNLTVTDSTEKHSSGADCSCTPQYQYSCVSQGYDCNNKCGQNVTEVYQAYKKDSHCFPGNSQPIPIAQQEYNNHNSTTCTNKPVTCPPCGVGGGGSDTINETN